MKNLLLKDLKDFLSLHLKGNGPLLVGVSRGEDSSALFSLLLECKSLIPMDFHVAHFDHSWREESAFEALLLKEHVQKHSISFHTERSTASSGDYSNLEDKARKERLGFFRKIYREIGAEALVLAHQRGDQAETVLKRIFEGSGILSCAGMQKVSFYEEMQVWRPILHVEREELRAYNQKNDWIVFQDRTNVDVKFLRPRMRQELFPMMEECFGKKVQKNLYKMGEELSFLKSFLSHKWEPLLFSLMEIHPLGSFLLCSSLKDEHPFEKQEIVRMFLQKQGAIVSSESLKKILLLLEENASHKEIDVSSGILFIERGDLIWLKKRPVSFKGQLLFNGEDLGIAQEGALWQGQISEKPLEQESLISSFLKGALSYRIPRGEECVFCSYDELSYKDQKRVSGFLSKNKIPAQLKRMFPFAIKSGVLFSFNSCFNLELNDVDSVYFLNIVLKI